MLNINKLLPGKWLSVLVLGLFLLLSGKSWAAELEPVSYTAYTSLFWLREAGVPEAAEYAKATGKQHLLFTGKIKNFYTLQPITLYSENGLNKQQLQRLDNMKNEKIVWLITI